MALTLTSLPYEVITSCLLPLLDDTDIINLCICGVVEPSEELYNRTFNDNTRFDRYTLQLFRERAECCVSIIGNHLGNPVGRAETIDPHLETIDSHCRMISPIKFCWTGSPILGVSAGDSVQWVNKNGELHSMGGWPERSKERSRYGAEDFFFDSFSGASSSDGGTRAEARQNVKDTFLTAMQYIGVKPMLQGIYNLPMCPTRFRDVGSWGSSFYGVDETGMVREWGRTEHPRQGAAIQLSDRDVNQVGAILASSQGKLRAGKHYKTCLKEGGGIIAWMYRSRVRGWSNGFPSCVARAWEVPDTSAGLRDFVLVGCVCVILWTDGTVSAVDLNVVCRFARDTRAMVYPLKEINLKGRFVQISGNSLNRLALVSESSTIVIVRVENAQIEEVDVRNGGPSFAIVQEEPDLDVAAVAVGGEHFLALTKQFEVYSWGREKDLNGCLGLGSFQDVFNCGHAKLEGADLVVEHPVKINVPGKVYGVFAGTDYSVFLVFDGTFHTQVKPITELPRTQAGSIDGSASARRIGRVLSNAMRGRYRPPPM